MWVIRSRWLCARPQQLHSVSNGATAALRQALDMVSSRNVAVQISIAISLPHHHNNNNKLYLNLDFTIYNPHLALIGYVVQSLIQKLATTSCHKAHGWLHKQLWFCQCFFVHDNVHSVYFILDFIHTCLPFLYPWFWSWMNHVWKLSSFFWY